MYKLIRYYNQNKKKVWVYILIIIFCFAIIQLLNYITKNNNQRKIDNKTTNINAVQEEKKYSVISQISVPDKKNEEIKVLIDTFIEHCNNKDVEAAYDMLSLACKDELFPTLEDFTNNYYNKIFIQKILYSMQSWITYNGLYTYQIKFMEDILSTGNSNDSNSFYDYITIVEETMEEKSNNVELKLNINSYIGREMINKKNTIYNIEVNVLYKDIYMDYEQYRIAIDNITDNTILLDTKENIDSVYLLGEKNLKYIGYMHEIDSREIVIESSKIKELNIKFDKDYNPEKKVKSINFTNVILNYNEYLSCLSKEDVELKTINISI